MQDLQQEETLSPDQAKWRNWTMAPKRREPKLAHYTSGIVLMTAMIIAASGGGV